MKVWSQISLIQLFACFIVISFIIYLAVQQIFIECLLFHCRAQAKIRSKVDEQVKFLPLYSWQSSKGNYFSFLQFVFVFGFAFTPKFRTWSWFQIITFHWWLGFAILFSEVALQERSKEFGQAFQYHLSISYLLTCVIVASRITIPTQLNWLKKQ